MSASYVTPKIEMKFSGLAGAWTDVTADVRNLDPIVCETGLWSRGATARVAEGGTLTFSFNNSQFNSGSVAGYYSLDASACRSGFARDIPVRYTITENGNSTVRFLGRLRYVDPVPGKYGTRITKCTAVDPFYAFSQMPIKEALDVQTSKTANQLLTTLLSTVDPDYGQLYTTSFDTGVSTFAYAFDSIEPGQTTVLDEINRIVMSEVGYCYFDPSTGTVVFKNASAESMQSVSLAFTESDMAELAVITRVDDLPTRVEVTANPAKFTAANTVLSTVGATNEPIHPGDSRVLVGTYNSTGLSLPEGAVLGGYSFTALSSGTDYTMNTAADGGGSDLTGNFTVTVAAKSSGATFTVTNNGTTAGYVTLLQVRGVGIYRTPTMVFSTNTYFPLSSRVQAINLSYQNAVNTARLTADYYAYFYADPSVPRADRVSFLASRSTTLTSQARQRNTFDRVTLTETQTGFSAVEFMILGVRLTLEAGGILRTTWGLECEQLAKWTDVTYAAGNFTAAGAMTWTVDSGDVSSYAYRLEGDMMILAFDLVTTTVGGTPNVALNIAVPASKTITARASAIAWINNNGTPTTGLIDATAAAGSVQIYLPSLGNWSASTNATSIRGQIRMQVS